MITLLRHWVGRQYLTHTLPKSNAQSVFLAVTPDDDLVKVLQELPGLATRQLHRFGALPAELQK